MCLRYVWIVVWLPYVLFVLRWDKFESIRILFGDNLSIFCDS